MPLEDPLVEPEVLLDPEEEPVALPVSLSLELRASEPELEDWDCIAVASWVVADVSITTSSIEPSFWPSLP